VITPELKLGHDNEDASAIQVRNYTTPTRFNSWVELTQLS